MKISVITTITNPKQRQDPYLEAIASYLDFADEVIVVDGGTPPQDLASVRDKIKVIFLRWPREWDWSELPAHLNLGLESASGDWVVKLDIDQILHEGIIRDLRIALEASDLPVAAMRKVNFITVGRCFEKADLPVAINKKTFSTIRFGEAEDKNTDLCQPIFPKGERIKQGTKQFVHYGEAVPEKDWLETGIPLYNYDCTFKTCEAMTRDFWRMAQAFARYFNDWSWGNTQKTAFDFWRNMMISRFKKCHEFPLDGHPKYIQEAIRNIRPEQFGYDGWGAFAKLK